VDTDRSVIAVSVILHADDTQQRRTVNAVHVLMRAGR
jgi:hypothetical protein